MVFWLFFCFFIFQSSLWCWEWKVREETLRGYAGPPKLVSFCFFCRVRRNGAMLFLEIKDNSVLIWHLCRWRQTSHVQPVRFFFLWTPWVFRLVSFFCIFQFSVWYWEGDVREEKLWSYAGSPNLFSWCCGLECRYDVFRDDKQVCSELAFVQVVLAVSREASGTDLVSSCSVRKRQNLCCFE